MGTKNPVPADGFLEAIKPTQRTLRGNPSEPDGAEGEVDRRRTDKPPNSSLKLAFTLSTYRLCDFVHLGLKQLRRLCPEADILASDDSSPESRGIEALAKQHGAAYICSKVRRGHFAADFNSFINALVFAKARECDVAVKVSQRFIFRKAEAVEAIRRAFENQDICVVTPGQPRVNGQAGSASQGFGRFTTLSDIVAIRVGAISPEEFLHMYRSRIVTEKTPWASFLECAIDDLHRKFAGRTVKLEELTNPQPDPWYLRRYQATDQDYRALAKEHGFNGLFTTAEWAQIERRNYLCRPRVA